MATNDHDYAGLSKGGGGGSRAAKKRRRQKGKVKLLGGDPPSSNSSNKPTIVGDAVDSLKGRVSREGNTNEQKQVMGKGKSCHGKYGAASSTDLAGGPSSISAKTKMSGKRKRDEGRDRGTSSKPPNIDVDSLPASVIDGDDVDDRSRLLLELDGHEVLGDPDVESGLKARQLLQWMIAPLPVEEFYEKYWETHAFVVQGRDPSYLSGWFHKLDLESFISGQAMQFGVDLDVTNYISKKRVTLNPAGPGIEAGGGGGAVVSPKFVWDSFRKGCSLRMPCPQKFSDPLHKLLAGLEEEFGCMVGSNVYLTPPGSQGFAPHWDDIEAFLLQVEGRKRWRVYRPGGETATLPRYSSPNLTDEEAEAGGAAVLDVTLSPGDLLYFPRGWAHQAETVGAEASLHITVSAMQGNCWADFLETLLPQAMASAALKNLSLRRGLPRDYLSYMGVTHSDEEDDQRRQKLASVVKDHLTKVVDEALGLLDPAADLMGRKFISDRLPPVLEEEEEAASVISKQEVAITPLSQLRMVRWGVARLLLEDGMAVVYHCMDNARVHHGNALSPLQFDLDDAPAIETLLAAYPHSIQVKDLPHPPTEDLEDKVGVATALYKEGFLLLIEPQDDSSANKAPEGGGSKSGCSEGDGDDED